MICEIYRLLSDIMSDEFDEVLLDFDGGDDVVLEGDEEAALAGAAHFEKGAFVAGEGAVDHADAFADHVGGQFGGEIVVRFGGGLDGADEALHLFGADGHWAAVGGASDVAELEGGGELDLALEALAVGVYEQQVGQHGALDTQFLAFHRGDPLLHRGEDLEALEGERLPGGVLRVGPLEVAEHVPLFCLHTVRTISSIPA